MQLGHIASIICYMLKLRRSCKPLRATVTYTAKCNLKCNMCGSWQRDDGAEELNLDEWKKIVSRLVGQGIKLLYIFGGEPFIRSDIYDFISYSKSEGLFCESVSNGTFFNERNTEKVVKSGLDKLCISLDGPEEIHDKIRGVPGSFDRAFGGLAHIAEAKKRLNSHTPYLEVESTVQRTNFRVIGDLLDVIKDVGVQEMRIRHMGVFLPDELKQADDILGSSLCDQRPLFSTGRDFLLRSEEIKQFRDLLPEIQDMGKQYGIKLNIEPAFYNVDDFLIGRKVNNCFHLWTQVYVDPWGRMHPCGWFDKFIMGSLLEQPFNEIWNGVKYASMRQNVSKIKACSKCCYFNITLKDNIKAALFKHRNMFWGLIGK